MTIKTFIGMMLILATAGWVWLAKAPTSDYQLVWQDEFDGQGMPDSTKWRLDLGNGCPNLCGWGNNELQYYTAKSPDNVRLENGRLIITARKEGEQTANFTSAKLMTKSIVNWKYGRFEIRAKLPKGRGTWPAIWMLPDLERPIKWPDDGEIDIMEHVGFREGYIHGTIHTKYANHMLGTEKGGEVLVEDATQAFHTYTLEWDENSLKWFIDGQQYHQINRSALKPEDWTFDKEFYLLLNLAVGGNWGGKEGIDPHIWPQTFEIDYVRVYQKQ